MTKQCELCDLPARMYCESDQASLCWECDGRVHGANFLVARHTRSLLCKSCQAPTPWRASGSRLGPTLSVCERCLSAGGADSGACEMEEEAAGGGGGGRIEAEVEGVGDLEVDDDEDDEEEEKDEDDDDDDEEEEEEDAENQVVPWSTEVETTTPPPVTSCSSSDESSSGRMTICQGFLRRMRENANPSTSQGQDELRLGCSLSQPGYFRPSPPSAAAASRSGRMLEEHEAETTSVGGPVRHRKRATLPTGPFATASRLRCDRRPHGAPATIDFFLPRSPSPPI